MIITALASGCAGPTRYARSAARFGAAAGAGATAARSAVGGARETCRMRAWLHAVGDRFERPGFTAGTDPLALPSGVPGPGGASLTWSEYCAGLARQDEAVLAALTALEAYAGALGEAAAQPASLDTSVVGALAADVDGLSGRLGGSSTAAQALSAPAGALARVVLELVRTRHLREAVHAGDAPLRALLAGLDAYVDAAGLELTDARSLATAVAREADLAIPVRPSGGRVPPELPGQALALYEFSRLELSRLEAAQAQLAATRQLVAALREAHAALVKGAGPGAPEVDGVIAAQVNEILAQVIALRHLDWRSL